MTLQATASQGAVRLTLVCAEQADRRGRIHGRPDHLERARARDGRCRTTARLQIKPTTCPSSSSRAPLGNAPARFSGNARLRDRAIHGRPAGSVSRPIADPGDLAPPSGGARRPPRIAMSDAGAKLRSDGPIDAGRVGPFPGGGARRLGQRARPSAPIDTALVGHALTFGHGARSAYPHLTSWNKASPQLPAGLGKLTTVVMTREICNWHRFNNRRAIGAQRKKAIGAVARRLAVDLWRVHTGRCTAAQLGLTI